MRNVIVALVVFYFGPTVASDTGGIESDLKKIGYSIFLDEKANPLTAQDMKNLIPFFRVNAQETGGCCDSPRRYSYSYDVSGHFIKKDKRSWALVSGFDIELLDRKEEAVSIIQKVFSLIGDNIGSKAFVSMIYIDEFRKLMEDIENKLGDATGEYLGGIIAVGPLELKWHQDKFGKRSQFDYLVFIILTCEGVEQHNLEIGLVNESDFEPIKNCLPHVLKPGVEPDVVASFTAKAYAGYVINQSKNIVHRRTIITYLNNLSARREVLILRIKKNE